MRRRDGQAAVEWTATLLVVLALLGSGAGMAAALGAPALARALRCALLVGCRGQAARLDAAYGPDVAALVRWYAPGIVYERRTRTLPVDFRSCRRHGCSDAPDSAGRDVWRSAAGRQATVFTHAVDLRRSGGDLFVQYWLYYPDSTFLGPAYRASRAAGPGVLGRLVALTPAGRLAHALAGHHADDWESYQVRIGADGAAFARASAHHGYAGRRRWPNLNELPSGVPVPRTGAWTRATGWTRVSRGSHAGHLVDRPGRERRTEADGLLLVPIESLPARARGTDFAISPPWRKPVYLDPRRNDT